MKGERRFRSIIGSELAPGTRVLLAVLGMAIAVVLWRYLRHYLESHDKNPRFAPLLGELWDGLGSLLRQDKRTGTVVFWEDTRASLWVLFKSLTYSLTFSVLLGVLMGVFSTVNATFSPVMLAIAKIPPLALIGLFLGMTTVTDDSIRVSLIVVGISPTLANSIMMYGQTVPKNIIVKAYSLGASTPEVVVKAMLPMMIPQIIQAIRLTIGPAWVYLIATEYIFASEGIGYRINLSAKMTEPAKIVVYCIWLAIIGTAMDYSLALLSRWLSPWAATRKDD